jgi:hypothetical protein
MNVIGFSRRFACLVCVNVLLVGQAIHISAQTVLVDFGSDTSFRGLSVPNPDMNGNYWNSLQPGLDGPSAGNRNLIDNHNNLTGFSLYFDTPVATDSYNGPSGGPTSEATKHTDVQFVDVDTVALGNLGGAKEAVFDYAASPGAATAGTGNLCRFEIQNLDPAKKYNLTFFGSHIFSFDQQTVYTVFSDNTYTTAVGTANLNVESANFQDYNHDMVATISNLSPQANNILYIQFVGANNHEGYLNDFQLVGSSVALAGDYNGNGKVDAADYVLWRKTPTSFGGDPAGYITWRANFGNPGAGATVGAVPEPATCALILLGAFELVWMCRRA